MKWVLVQNPEAVHYKTGKLGLNKVNHQDRAPCLSLVPQMVMMKD